MSKLLSTVIFAALAMIGMNAQAASHTGGAPMKSASAPDTKASAPAKKADKAKVKKEAKKEAAKS